MEVCGAKKQQSQKHLSSSMMEIHLFIKPRKYTVYFSVMILVSTSLPSLSLALISQPCTLS